MDHEREDALWTEAIAGLEAEIADLEQDRAQSEHRIRELRASEDLKAGIVYAREIFQLQQDKLRLGVEIDLRQKKINRIKYQRSHGQL